MLEDLRKLKKELEDKRHYVLVDNITSDSIKNGSIMTLEDMANNDQTDETLKCMEELFKKSLNYLYSRSLPVNSLCINANIGLFLKKTYADSLNNSLNDLDSYNITSLYKQLRENTNPSYMSVDMSLNYANSMLSNEFKKEGSYYVSDYIKNKYNSNSNLTNEHIKGIVNVKKFVTKLNELGYIYVLEDGMPFRGIEDYADLYTEVLLNKWNFNYPLNIIANLDLNNENHLDVLYKIADSSVELSENKKLTLKNK